eukprot:SAG31_NODE_4778_length_2959_cov_17.543706_1_plen_57_part_00
MGRLGYTNFRILNLIRGETEYLRQPPENIVTLLVLVPTVDATVYPLTVPIDSVLVY